uniref:IAP n=1 Tax=Malaco herpesvirus 1 TaxID=3031797 RepID=A0AA48P850_9VIRU|nr:TPA_asm: putative IAP [Malaco herpesvirus 1]
MSSINVIVRPCGQYTDNLRNIVHDNAVTEGKRRVDVMALDLQLPLMTGQSPNNLQITTTITDVRQKKIISANANYEHAAERLSSFKNWGFKPSAHELTQDGFFYTGKNDTIECFSCGLRVRNMNNNTNIRSIHRQQARKADGENGGYACLFLTNFASVPEYFASQNYESYQVRLRTFLVNDWPTNQFTGFDSLNPVSLAKAGFFYSGERDKCICYACGLGVHQWEPKDKPLEEHKRLNGYSCTFLAELERQGTANTGRKSGKDVVG